MNNGGIDMDNTKKYALLFKMLCEKYDGSTVLGKKASQKIFYFFEREGIELNLRYGIHYYGPYSSKLDDAMYELESEGYLSIDTSGTTHTIQLGHELIPDTYLSEQEKHIAAFVLETFAHKSPMELEALTTMDYIANSLLSKEATEKDIIDKFKQIKGEKFSQRIIDHTLQELKSLNLIAA